MNEGGDKRTPRAKVDIAKREQQIVALKLRGIATPEISRVIGVTARAVQAAFKKALRRQTEDALDAWHRTELGALAMGGDQHLALNGPPREQKRLEGASRP